MDEMELCNLVNKVTGGCPSIPTMDIVPSFQRRSRKKFDPTEPLYVPSLDKWESDF